MDERAGESLLLSARNQTSDILVSGLAQQDDGRHDRYRARSTSASAAGLNLSIYANDSRDFESIADYGGSGDLAARPDVGMGSCQDVVPTVVPAADRDSDVIDASEAEDPNVVQSSNDGSSSGGGFLCQMMSINAAYKYSNLVANRVQLC